MISIRQSGRSIDMITRDSMSLGIQRFSRRHHYIFNTPSDINAHYSVVSYCILTTDQTIGLDKPLTGDAYADTDPPIRRLSAQTATRRVRVASTRMRSKGWKIGQIPSCHTGSGVSVEDERAARGRGVCEGAVVEGEVAGESGDGGFSWAGGAGKVFDNLVLEMVHARGVVHLGDEVAVGGGEHGQRLLGREDGGGREGGCRRVGEAGVVVEQRAMGSVGGCVDVVDAHGHGGEGSEAGGHGE